MQYQEEKIPNLLEKIELSKFQLKEFRNLDDFEQRNLDYSAKSIGKTLEVTYNNTFNFDLLLTHIELELHQRDLFDHLFEIGLIEASCLTNRGIFIPVIRTNPFKKSGESKSTIIPAITITQSLKVSLLLRKEFTSICGEQIGFKKQRSKASTEENVLKMILHAIKAINICGYHLSMNTSASQLVPLLNISQSFKHSKRYDEAAQADILVSLSLISARRFVQASQLLRKVSRFYVDKYISSKSSMQFSRIDRSWIKQEVRQPSEFSGLTRSFTTGRVLDGGRYLYKAAKIELLLAQTINQPSLLGQKLQAYHRMNCFSNGNANPGKISMKADYEQMTYSIGSSIIPFLVKILNDKSEILKISSLKSIQFFFQNLGCTLGGFMPLILRTLINFYPNLKDRQETQFKTEDNLAQRNQYSSRTKLLLDHINHLLESLLSLLGSMSKKYLKLIFEQILLTSISDEFRNELRLYLLRFAEKIMQICGPDLQISIHYIKYIFSVGEGKLSIKSESTSKHINHNLIYFSQRIIDLLKTKFLKNYHRIDPLNAICNWMHESLVYLCQNDIISCSSQLNHILDMIIVIYTNTRFSLTYPVEPIIYLLNTSLHQHKMPFEKILEAFVILVQYGDRSQNEYGLGGEIIERIMTRSKISTLSVKELKILQKMLQFVKQANLKWLEQFLNCIPHSNFDEIYSVFDLLIVRCLRLLNKDIIRQIINTLFNQYTVKGKAHQQSKDQFITNIIKEESISLELILQLCLFQNCEPKEDRFYSKKFTEGEHWFDTKLFKLHSELFMEKINLLLLIFSKSDIISAKFIQIFTNQNILKINTSLKGMLLESTNFKMKSKVLILVKELILTVQSIQPNSQQGCQAKLLFAKVILDSMKSFLGFHKDNKMHYYTILNIGLVFQMIPTIKEFQPINQVQLGEGVEKCKLDSASLSINQIISIWPNLMLIFNSPWENVREILMLTILNTLKNGLSNLPQSLKLKLCQTVRQFLVNFMQSNDHTERAMGLKLLCCLIGFAGQCKDRIEYCKQICSNWRFFKNYIEIVMQLQNDWNEQIATISKLVIKVCISKQSKELILKRIKSDSKNIIDNSLYSLNFEEQAIFDKKPNSLSCLESFQMILKADDDFNVDEDAEIIQLTEQSLREIQDFRKLMDKLSYFSVDNMPEKDSFAEEQHYFDPNDQKHSDKDNENSEDEQLEFEDLGIIELDDEEWGEEENQMKITQKLPLKKVYKLSPNLGSSSKHHRIRNKRYHHSEFQEDKIIIDELEGRINSPILNSPKEQFGEKLESNYRFEEEPRNRATEDMEVTSSKPVAVKKQKQKQKKTAKKRKSSTIK